MFDALFISLEAKTFALLAGGLLVALISAYGIIYYFHIMAVRGSKHVAKELIEGEYDLIPTPYIIKKLFYPLLMINIIAFLYYLYGASRLDQRLLAYFIFTLTGGLTIGLALLTINERLGLRVLFLTALLTGFAGIVGYYGNLNIAWIGTYLFFALLILLVITIFRLFIRIKGWLKRIIALSGILIFFGFILYDFSRLKAASASAINDWETALSFSVSIYLDIINLFLQILDLLSKG